jgi:hypothetical protein
MYIAVNSKVVGSLPSLFSNGQNPRLTRIPHMSKRNAEMNCSGANGSLAFFSSFFGLHVPVSQNRRSRSRSPGTDLTKLQVRRGLNRSLGTDLTKLQVRLGLNRSFGTDFRKNTSHTKKFTLINFTFLTRVTGQYYGHYFC